MTSMNDEAFYRWLGFTIRRERERCGLTAGDVAGSLGVSRDSYLNYEEGRRVIRPHLLVRVARLVGSNVDQLLQSAARGSPEADTGVLATTMNRDRLADLTEQEAQCAPVDVPRLSAAWDQSIYLIDRLEAGDLETSIVLLTKSITCKQSHILRFILSSDDQLRPEHRDRAIDSLLRIYESSGASTLEKRAAREQAAYLAGASGLRKARESMESAWGHERDKWVRRSIVRGLAKAGLVSKIAEGHEQELAKSAEMQQIDLGYWRFYAGDEHHLDVALSGQLPSKGYTKTIGSLIFNLVSRMPRDDRRFDFVTLATLLDHVNPRTISDDQRNVISCVLAAKPREPQAEMAWLHLRHTAESIMELPPVPVARSARAP